MEFGALTGVGRSGGVNFKERDLNETAGPVARNEQSVFGSDTDISKGQLPEGCRELGNF